MLTKDQVERIEREFPFPHSVLALCGDWHKLQARLSGHVASIDKLEANMRQAGAYIDTLRAEREGFRAEALSALAERDQFRMRLAVKDEQLELARLAIREIYTYMMEDMGFSGDDMRCVISTSSAVQLDAALQAAKE